MYLGVIAIICKMKMIPVFCSINCYRNTQTCMPVCTYTYLDCLCFPIALNASLHYLWCLKIRSFDMLFNPSLPPVSFFCHSLTVQAAATPRLLPRWAIFCFISFYVFGYVIHSAFVVSSCSLSSVSSHLLRILYTPLRYFPTLQEASFVFPLMPCPYSFEFLCCTVVKLPWEGSLSLHIHVVAHYKNVPLSSLAVWGQPPPWMTL